MTTFNKSIKVNFVVQILILAVFLAIPVTSFSTESFNIVTGDIADMYFLKTGDLDLDGEVDLVYSGWFHGGRIAYGEGGGNFEAADSLPFSVSSAVAIGYVNGDTLLDIIAVGFSDIFVLLNNGDRTFTTSSWPHSTSAIPVISTGYFNNDPFLDFVASPATIFYGDGNGNFGGSTNLAYGNLVGADVTDFNRDGYDDIIVLEGTGYTNARVLLNNGSATFTESDSVSLGSGSLSVSTNNAMADFNNDGNPDFALITPHIGVACSANYWISVGTVVFGDGNGTVASTETFGVCGTSYGMVTADVDGDLQLDIVAMNGSFKRMEVVHGNGDGTFETPERVPVGAQEITFVVATDDIDHDGNPDFITNGTLSDPDNIYTAINNAPDKHVLPDQMVTTGFSTVDFGVTNPDGHRISRLWNSVAGARYERLDKNSDGALDVQTVDNNLEYGDYTIVLKKKPDVSGPATFDATVRIGDQVLKLFKNYETPGTSKSSSANDSIVFHLAVEPSSSVAPANGHTVYDNTPDFNWTPLTANKSTDTYQIQIDDQYDFSSPIMDVSGLPTKTYTATVPLTRDNIYYWHVRSFDGLSYSEWSNAFAVYVGPFFCGDVNNDGVGPNILDLVAIVNYLFRNGPPPMYPEQADLNGDHMIANTLDLTVLVNYMHRNGPLPNCGLE